MLQEIEISRLRNHPKNVRRTYGDIEELADSIKKNGVMQNLTVIPDPEKEGCYLVVIGNRRLLAAQKAGLETVPCQITEMDEKTVAETMLLENMQRNDLSIIDQAYGFQLCLDLGDTAADIAEKTGLSKQTVKHRIEIARLDEESLERRFGEENFQMRLSDLIALEKVKDINKRNEILNSAYSSAEMRRLAENAARDERREEEAKKIIRELGLNIKPAPKKMQDQIYSDRVEKVASFELDGHYTPEYAEDQKKKVKAAAAGPKQLYYLVYWQNLQILREAEPRKEQKQPEISAKEKREKGVKAFCRQMEKDRNKFIDEILAFKHSTKNRSILMDLFECMFSVGASCSNITLMQDMAGSSYWKLSADEHKALKEKIKKIPLQNKCLMTIRNTLKGTDTIDWRGVYDKEAADRLVELYAILSDYGFAITEEELQILNGTHEIYKEPAE